MFSKFTASLGHIEIIKKKHLFIDNLRFLEFIILPNCPIKLSYPC